MSQTKRQRDPLAKILLGLLLVMGIVLLFMTNWLLSLSHKNLLARLEQEFNTNAGNQVSLLTVWSNTIQNQIDSFVNMDMLRLFANEVAKSQMSVTKILQMARNGKEKEQNNQEYLVNAPVMYRQLLAFIERNSFITASLLNSKLEVYLTPQKTPEFNPEQKKILQQVLNEAQMQFLPTRKESGDLVVDVAFPVLAPKYLEDNTKQAVGVFVGTFSIKSIISAINTVNSERIFISAVLEKKSDGLHLLDTLASTSESRKMYDWTLEDGKLPLAQRDVPGPLGNTALSYSLAVPVPGTNLLVLRAQELREAEASQYSLRRNIFIVCGFIFLMLILVIVMVLWRRQVGLRYRELTENLRSMYTMLNEQKQVIDGVNKALPVGVVLNDLSGILYYTNQCYAEMVGLQPEQMRGLNYEELPEPLALSMVTHTIALNESGKALNFTETLTLADKEKHTYMTQCSPFLDNKKRLVGMVSVYIDLNKILQVFPESEEIRLFLQKFMEKN